MEKDYAQALWDSVERGMEPGRAVRALHKVLVAQGRQELAPRIARSFARLAGSEDRKRKLVLSVAREGDAAAAKREAESVLEKMDAGAKEAEVSIDDSLIGGWRLEGRERLVDASFKKSLLEMYNRATS